jgi:Flp pilus assembly protein TadB
MTLRKDGSIQALRGPPDDVIRVHQEVASAIAARDRERRRTPWASGSFYLVVLVVAVLVLLLVGRALPLWALPITAVAAVLIVVIVGALQLRQDERLSERNFLRLMAAVLARLPSLLRLGRSGTDGRPDA